MSHRFGPRQNGTRSCQKPGGGTLIPTITEVRPTKTDNSVWKYYGQLSRAFRSILKICPDKPIQGLHWIYARHYPSPTALSLLSVAQGKDFTWHDHFYLFFRLFGFLLLTPLYILHSSLLSLVSRCILSTKLKELKKIKIDVLGQSFMVGPHFGPNQEDFYFGNFQDELKKRGKTTVFLYINFTQRSIANFSRYLLSGNLHRLSEWVFYRTRDSIKVYVEQWKGCIKLICLFIRTENRLLKKIFECGFVHVLSQQTHKNCLFFWMWRRSVCSLSPNATVLTYEGQAWEALALAGIKSADPMCKTMGYQHTVLFKESHSIFDTFSTLPSQGKPDVVLSTGTYPIEIMKSNENQENVKYLAFGSYRFQEGAKTREPADFSRKSILVTPEGLSREMVLLFSFAAQCAQALPDYKFIFRCHPVHPFEKVKHLLPTDILERPNIELSTNKNMKDDFNRCSVLLNRRSSTGLYAIMNGLRLVFLRQEGKVESDPLFNLTSWRWECASVNEFGTALKEMELMTSVDEQKEWIKANELVGQYAMAVTDDSYQNFINVLGVN